MNKDVLITGGSRGIGSSAAIKYASKMVRVHFLYHRDNLAAYNTLTRMIDAYISSTLERLSVEIGKLWIKNALVDKKLNSKIPENFVKKISKNIIKYEDFEKIMNKYGYYQYNLYQNNENYLDSLVNSFSKLSTAGSQILEDLTRVKCCIFKGDIGDKEYVDNLVDKLILSVKKIDYLVSNAGVDSYYQLQDIKEEEIKRVVTTNLIGTINICSSVSKHMIREKYGKIVTLSSMWALTGSSCESLYSATKGGIISFTKSIAKELGPSSINCNCIAPGVVMTDMMKDFTDEDIRCLVENSSLKKVSTAEKVAESIYFLTSEKAEDYNGKVFEMDCGYGQI